MFADPGLVNSLVNTLYWVVGTIVLASYLGNTLRYDVQAAGDTVLKVDVRDPWHHDLLPIGQTVTLTFPPSVVLPLPDA